MTDAEVGNFSIPNIQKKIDTLVHEIVTLLNNASESGIGLDGNAGIPIFVRKSGATGAENPNDYDSLFTLNNIEINPELLEGDGYNNLGFSKNGDKDDNTILIELSEK